MFKNLSVIGTRPVIASFSWREVDVILLEMTFAEFGPKVSESATYGTEN